MTYKDYFDWANEYREQGEVLERLLNNRKSGRRKLTAEQQVAFDSESRTMYLMKLDCERTAAVLEQKARVIRERLNEA